jgi:hypothetical protein
MEIPNSTIQREMEAAQEKWGPLRSEILTRLEPFINDYHLSVRHGDLILLGGSWYVTHAGLLRLSRRKHCAGITVSPVHKFCDRLSGHWAFKATAFRSPRCRGFVGYGDADPSNVSPLVRGAEMRIAETRAVNRALRKAYGIGLCSVEEIPSQNTSDNGAGLKVRDRLCQLIRQHQLDPELVKAYAVDFCGTKTLRDASRQQIENFVQQLADWANRDRNALLCQLNSYMRPKQEVVA